MSQLQEFDAYVLDGLAGHYFTLIDQLPKEKCYLHTNSWKLKDEAEERGYQILRGSIENLIN